MIKVVGEIEVVRAFVVIDAFEVVNAFEVVVVTPVFISGTGLVTPLGATVDSTWRAMLDGRFVTDTAPALFDASPSSPRIVQLALEAAREAIAGARWSASILSDDRTALVVGTSKGPVETWTHAPPSSIFQTSDNPEPAGRLSFGLTGLIDPVARSLKHGYGPRLTTSAACASALHALIRAKMMISSGQVDRALVIGAEASLQPVFTASFKRLGVLAPPGFGCRPFDEARDGFVMSEAAAAVCLERSASSADTVRIGRVALGGDATHLTSGDPTNQTLRRLLQHVIHDGQTVGNPQIDLVHAHGTGTRVNDAAEIEAIESTLCPTMNRQGAPQPQEDFARREASARRDEFARRDNFAPRDDFAAQEDSARWDRSTRCDDIASTVSTAILFSHKAALGHTLGVAGLIAVVLNVESHRQGVVPPNVRTTQPIPTRLLLSKHAVKRRIQRSLITAAGFGGAIGVVGLESD